VKSHTVDIAGQKVSLRSDASEAHVRRLAEMVNARVKAMRAAAPGAPVSVALALAAIQLADDLSDLEEFAVRERREVAAEVRRTAGELKSAAQRVDDWLESAGREDRSKGGGAGKDGA
jgi:cell division protein ZapA (FtsZ GTPase activity inhibitor)